MIPRVLLMRRLQPLLVLVLLAGLNACSVGVDLQRPAPLKQTFLLELQRDEVPTRSNAPTLVLAPVRMASAYEGRALVYRMQDDRFESDFYNQWFSAPRDQVGEAVAYWMRRGGVFADVLPPILAGEADYRLDVVVTDFYVDMRDAAEHRARVTLQAYLSARETAGRRLIARVEVATDAVVVPAEGESVGNAQSRVTALADALGKALARLETGLAQALN